MKYFSKILLIAILLLIIPYAWADQMAILDKKDAQRAVKLLKKKKEIKFYCAPCNENIPTHATHVENIRIKEFKRRDGSSSYSLDYDSKEKKEGIDLAYIYYNKRGIWKNVAIELGLDVSDVPATIN